MSLSIPKNVFKTLLFGGVFAFTQLHAQGQQVENSAVAVERNNSDQTIKSMRFAETAKLTPQQANELFSTYLGIDGKENQMVHKHSTTTKTGLSTIRYTQFYKGIKVEYGGATLVVKDNLVRLFTGNYYNFSDHPSTEPKISEAGAFSAATQFVGAEVYKWQIPEEESFIKKITRNPDTSFLPKGRLVWIENMMDDDEDRKIKLAYCFDIYAEKPLSRQQVFVDATTGAILFSNSIIKHTAASGASRYSGTVAFKTAKPSATYVLFDSTRGNGVQTLNLNNGTSYGSATNFSSATNTWPTSAAHNIALDVHWGSEMVYDYWLKEQGRFSWDDMDGILQSYVHYSSGFNNAFWNGAYMTYGDGSGSSSGGFDPLTSLDVTAHEIGHGVCEATSNLVYQKEAGAMNEGLSDCWGATIEHYADPHETDAQPKKTWYIGEEIGAGTPLRRMDFPKLRNDPDTYGGTYWYNITGCTPTASNDYCGVHNNSGVMNKFYYLLTDGGTGTNDKGNVYAVTGLGWTKAPAILYQTELILTSTATFMDCRTASINIAILLYGPCSPEVKSVTDAWYAVGVGAAFTSCITTIGFEVTSLDINEVATSTSCPASTVYKVGIKPIGTLFTGGSPVVSVTVAGGTAVSGKDYALSGTTMTFTPGSSATQYANLTVFDDGTVNDTKTLKLAFTLNPMGSSATINPGFDTLAITLNNNDSIPSIVNPVSVETNIASTRTWPAPAGEEVYFYNPTNNNLIAGLQNTNKDLGCVQAQITQAGNGMKSAVFSPVKRSLKEITVTPAINGPSTTYDVVIYFSNTELAGTTPSSLLLLKTDAATDATINKTNATVAKPSVISGTNYVGFKATFTGFNPSSRFMLVDDTLCTPPVVSVNAASDTNLCAGKSVTLQASTGTGYTYQWLKDGGVISGATTSSYTTSTAGNYSVQISASGCPAATRGIMVSVKPAPDKYSVTGGGKFCTGSAGMPIGLSGSTSGVSYQLYLSGGPVGSPINGSGSALDFGTFSNPGNYTVVATDNTNFCIADMTGLALIEQIDPPVATVSPSGTVSVNENNSTQLNASKGTDYTYQWLKDGASVAGKTDASFTASEAGVYQVVVSNGLCSDTSTGTTIVVVKEEMKLTLLPNPNDGVFSIKGMLDESFDGKATIAIFNMLGQKLYSYEADVTKGSLNASFSLSQLLAKARYLVKLNAGAEEHVFHLLIGK